MEEKKVQENLVSLYIPSSQNLHLSEENIRNQLTLDDDDEKQWERLLVKEVKEITSYKFKNPDLLYEAFSHSSFQENCKLSYDRLEFLGDSVLNTLIAMELYLNYPNLPPGKLTKLRAANVDTEKLARVAIKYNLHNYLRHKNPTLEGRVEEYKKAILEYPLHSVGLVDPPKTLAIIVKSLIGAIYIDSNFCMDTTWQVVKDLLQPLITLEKLEIHPVTQLYEFCQKNRLKIKVVNQWEKTKEIEIFVNEKFVGKGKSNNVKKIAMNRAAHNAYYQVVKNLSMEATIHDDDHQSFDEIQC